MDDQAVIQAFQSLRCWKRDDHRAPHKPLLLLLALAKVQRGEDRWLSYEEVEEPLKALLREYGPPSSNVRVHYPFWRLTNDRLWQIDKKEQLEAHVNNSGDVPPAALQKAGARGTFSDDLWQALKGRPDLVNRVAAILLEKSFAASLHDDILNAVGFPWVVETDRKRDPKFRDAILRIYEHRCGICGYDGRLGPSDLALEAAHLKWHAAGGPDSLDNGIALCAFHHKALDRGAATVDDDHRIQISQEVHGATGVEELLLRYAGQPLRGPQRGQPPPAADFVRWHQREVFRRPARIGPA